MKSEILNKFPYQGGMSNNRKMTLDRLRQKSKIRSIPIFEKDEFGRKIQVLGYKYIQHQ